MEGKAEKWPKQCMHIWTNELKKKEKKKGLPLHTVGGNILKKRGSIISTVGGNAGMENVVS
jgi:hypothetical protein